MIRLKTNSEIKILREGGKILAAILRELGVMVRPGISTGDLEKKARELIRDAGGRPAFLGYKSPFDPTPFPTALCTSINEEVVHAPALPSRILNEGDIIGIDIGMEFPIRERSAKNKFFNKRSRYGGYYTDMAITVAVGKVDEKTADLIKTTKNSLAAAIEKVKPGNTLNDIGSAVQDFAEARGFSVVRDLVGHGVGHEIHEEPQVPNYRISKNGPENIILKTGMVIAIEPMINLGGYKIELLENDTTLVTSDGSLSAHFEHTVAVTDKGCKVITAL